MADFAIIQRKCLCGLDRIIHERTGLLWCINCDIVMPEEYEPEGKRIRTADDVQFDLAMNARINNWYPEQRK